MKNRTLELEYPYGTRRWLNEGNGRKSAEGMTCSEEVKKVLDDVNDGLRLRIARCDVRDQGTIPRKERRRSSRLAG